MSMTPRLPPPPPPPRSPSWQPTRAPPSRPLPPLSPPAYTQAPGCPSKSHADFNDFKGCIECPDRVINVPRIKYILNQQPVVYESIDSETRYDKVPVNYEFEKRVYPVKVTKPCSPCEKYEAPCAAPCDTPCERPFAPLPLPCDAPCAKPALRRYGRRAPCAPKIPCSIKTAEHFNRSPCAGDALRYPYGPYRPFGFPRWRSQYVPFAKSPCAVSTTALCGLRGKCSSC